MPRKGEKKLTAVTARQPRVVPFKPLLGNPPAQQEYEIRVGAQPELQRVVKRRLVEMLALYPAESIEGIPPLDIGQSAATAATAGSRKIRRKGESAFQAVTSASHVPAGFSTPPREADMIAIHSTSGDHQMMMIPYPGIMLRDLCARLKAHRGGEIVPSPSVSPILALDRPREGSPTDFLIMRSDRAKDGRPSSPAEDMLCCDEAFAQMGLDCQRLAGLVQ